MSFIPKAFSFISSIAAVDQTPFFEVLNTKGNEDPIPVRTIYCEWTSGITRLKLRQVI